MAASGPPESSDGRFGLTAVLAALAVIFASAIVMIAYLANRPANYGPIEIHPPAPTPTEAPAATRAPLIVYVTGAVGAPGVVEVFPGARVEDAVVAAGGTTAEADLLRCNMAAPLSDGQHLHVPVVGEVVPDAAEGGQPGIVNINSATVEELMALPGVGEVTAGRIVAYREEHGPFSVIDEIMQVPGIGQAKFDGFADRITVGP